MTDRFRAAVLGSPIAHSRSPQLHLACYDVLRRPDCTYQRIEVRRGGLAAFVQGLDDTWMGLSLTMPLKEEALSLVDNLEPSATRIGAINTIVFWPGVVAGFNTDQIGFREVLRPRLPRGGTAAVVGTGATARSALSALADYEPREVVVVGRDLVKFLGLIERFPELRLRFVDWPASGDAVAAPAVVEADVVLCTLPKTVDNPLAPLPGQYLVDVNYPDPPNLRRWLAAGGQGEDGVELLIYQGVVQAGLFLRRELTDEVLAPMVDSARRTVRDSLEER